MRLGFLQIYNDVQWASVNISQTMKLCDKLLIIEGSQFAAFPEIPERSNDGTLDIITDKIKEYPNRITLLPTTRKHKNYRQNQCDNFNLALTYCKNGDYLIPTDADKILFEESVTILSDLMKEEHVETIKFFGLHFAFSFNWQYIENDNPKMRDYIYKKIPGFHFEPTHKHINNGSERIVLDGIHFHHYKWLKSTQRLRNRFKTSGFVGGMLNWFDNNWENIQLNDKPQKFCIGKLQLKSYDGPHPIILNDHLYRNITDVRELYK